MSDNERLTRREVQLIIDTVLKYGPPIGDDVWRPIEEKLWAQVREIKSPSRTPIDRRETK